MEGKPDEKGVDDPGYGADCEEDGDEEGYVVVGEGGEHEEDGVEGGLEG